MKIDLESVCITTIKAVQPAWQASVNVFWLVLEDSTPPFLPSCEHASLIFLIFSSSKTLAPAGQAESCHDLKGLKVLFKNVSQK